MRKLIIYLEDRRVLFNPYSIEDSMHGIESVLKIRDVLTETLQALDEKSDIVNHIRIMRASCRKFLNVLQDFENKYNDFRYSRQNPIFFTMLGELRYAFGLQIAQLCVKYGINIEGDLACIIPIEDYDNKKIESPEKRKKIK